MRKMLITILPLFFVCACSMGADDLIGSYSSKYTLGQTTYGLVLDIYGETFSLTIAEDGKDDVNEITYDGNCKVSGDQITFDRQSSTGESLDLTPQDLRSYGLQEIAVNGKATLTYSLSGDTLTLTADNGESIEFIRE